MTQSVELPPDLVELLKQRTREERRMLMDCLRQEFPIHALEEKLNTRAEVILEAISRASDLTLRGIRGIIAEAAFKQDVLVPMTLPGLAFEEEPIVGDHPYDFAIRDAEGRVTIQVKMQRQKAQRPMLAREASKRIFANLQDEYVVETQRTRGGTRNGVSTRPYHFGEFDILAVSLHPSTDVWSDFLYTVESWLIPDPNAPEHLFKYQPVPRNANGFWSDQLSIAVQWLRDGAQKRLPLD